jgi:hypothetical protein
MMGSRYDVPGGTPYQYMFLEFINFSQDPCSSLESAAQIGEPGSLCQHIVQPEDDPPVYKHKVFSEDPTSSDDRPSRFWYVFTSQLRLDDAPHVS